MSTLEKAAWALRDPEFGGLATRAMPDSTDEVVMQFGPATRGQQATANWQSLVALWRELPRNPALLSIAHVDEAGEVWLDYAALDWRARKPVRHLETLARWVVQLSRAFESIAKLPHESWKYFAKPCVYTDIGGHIRLAFLPAFPEDQRWLTSLPPNERVWVTCTAKLVEIAASDSDNGKVFFELTRHKTLRRLREAFQKEFLPETERIGTTWSAWTQLERGLGWLELNKLDEAVARLTASKSEATSTLAITALERCKILLDPPPPPSVEEPVPSWIQRADVSRRAVWNRPPDFGGLSLAPSGEPVMELVTGHEEPGWEELARAWRSLAPHPNILTLAQGSARCVHYAAIDWSWEPTSSASKVAGWVGQLVSAFEVIAERPKREWQQFARPLANIDTGGHVRLAFVPAPPDDKFDEKSLVLVVGRVLEALCPNPDDLTIARSMSQRYESLARLASAFTRMVSQNELERTGDRRRSWDLAERGLGFYWLERWEEAFEAFLESNARKNTPIAEWGIAVCRRKLKVLATRARWWRDVKDEIASAEATRDYEAALALYGHVHVTERDAAEIYARRARCHLERHELGDAIDYASRSLELAPGRTDARQTRIRAQIERKAHNEALPDVDALLAINAHDPTVHYLRGKVFIGLGRLEDARDAFDLAIALRPTMIEAMLLRREADKSLAKLGKSVGSQHATLALPASLESLRDVLASGRSKPIIEALFAPSLADDADAQLMLARFLGFADRREEAIAIYERYLDSAHRTAALIGKAGALLDTGRIESALALFEVAVAETPQDLDACEGRARTLDTLGRTSEAAAEFRRFVELGRRGANLRVRVAQIWLERH